MKILAVDDDESIRALLSEAVAMKSKHALDSVHSGPEAIRTLARAKIPYDCLLIDIQMPVMDGITLVAKIRKIKEYARTPIIMLTAMAQKKYVDQAFAAGATDYVTKPFDFLELFSRLSLAEKMVHEQRRLAQTTTEMSSLKRDLLYNTAHSLNEPIEILGVTQVVGYVAFENYLMQLSRGKLLRSAAFGVKVSNIGAAYKRLSATDFRQMLTEVSSELVSVTGDNGAMATYRGNGMFLCLLPRHGAFSNGRHEVELNSRLEFSGSPDIHGADTKLCVGEAFGLRALTRAGALFALQKASASAETRAKSQRDVIAMLRRTVRLNPRSGFQTEMERRAYEVLLQDALRDDEEHLKIAAFG